MKLKLLLSTVIFLSVFSIQASIVPNVIYGDDDRVEFYQISTVYQDLSRSTAAMINQKRVLKSDNQYRIIGKTLHETGVCLRERFSEQLSIASCTGFLVSDELIVTAGHCIRNQYACDNNLWVFDYSIKSKNQVGHSVNQESVYRCVEIVDRVLDNVSFDDYAVIRLDRSVVGRMPLKYRKSGVINDNTSIFIIGHPSGLPLKVAGDASVRSTVFKKYFVANLDSYRGNSGSPVFNSETLEVEGILVRGNLDYQYDSIKQCSFSRVCAMNSCRGEDITRITNLNLSRY